VGSIIAHGFWNSSPVHIALAVGVLAATVTGIVGTFVVLRGQSFAGDAFSHIGTVGGSGGFLLGIGPLPGYLIAGFSASGLMELLGEQRGKGRDLATGIVLGGTLGLSALFLYLTTTSQSLTGSTVTILFGSIFTTSSGIIPIVLALTVGVLITMTLLYRPLLLSTIQPEVARARQINLKWVGLIYLLALATATAISAITIGTILSTALLIGPPATVLPWAKTPRQTIMAAVGVGIVAVILGIILAYDSYNWASNSGGWPVSFFVVTLIFFFYLISHGAHFISTRVPSSAKSDDS
jgi:zinc/manganese transport system permease protein